MGVMGCEVLWDNDFLIFRLLFLHRPAKFLDEKVAPFTQKHAKAANIARNIAPLGVLVGSIASEVALANSLSEDIKNKAAANYAKGKAVQRHDKRKSIVGQVGRDGRRAVVGFENRTGGRFRVRQGRFGRARRAGR